MTEQARDTEALIRDQIAKQRSSTLHERHSTVSTVWFLCACSRSAQVNLSRPFA